MAADHDNGYIRWMVHATGFIELVMGGLLLLAVGIAFNIIDEFTPTIWLIGGAYALYALVMLGAGVAAFSRPGRLVLLHLLVGCIAMALFVVALTGARGDVNSAKASLVLGVLLASGVVIVSLTLATWIGGRSRPEAARCQSEGSS